ncbi:MAG: metalloregulator ArsR/SmtB family transcription factor, partial [Chloroflexota bacterium]
MSRISLEEATLLHQHACRAIADPKRILILYALNEEPSNVTHLSESLQLPQSTVSRHLKQLLNHDLVIADRQGTTVTYSLADTHIIDALNTMRQVVADSLRRQ